jgi:CRP/FNR family transcriptional regulator, cyclic AMP receptor protein
MHSSDVRPPVKAPATGPPFQLQSFADLHGGVFRYKAASGSAIYRQEEVADTLYYLEQGRIVLKVASPQGKDVSIGLLGAGAFIGEECLTSRTSRFATAICLVDSLVARIEKASVLRAIRQDPRFAMFYLGWVVSHGEALKEGLISQLTDGSERRLARILLQLASLQTASLQMTSHQIASHDGQAAAGSVEGFDQEALAQMVGTTRPRVNYFMNRFRDLGYIAYNGKITVHESLWRIVLGQDRGGADEDFPGANQGH